MTWLSREELEEAKWEIAAYLRALNAAVGREGRVHRFPGSFRLWVRLDKWRRFP